MSQGGGLLMRYEEKAGTQSECTSCLGLWERLDALQELLRVEVLLSGREHPHTRGY